MTYGAVEVYHACRPQNIDEYYLSGLRTASHADLNEAARKIFLTSEFPEVTPAALDQAIAALSPIDHGFAYVALDDRTLLEHCGHYLIYGSEHICGIAAKLFRDGCRDYRQILKRFGRPTVVQLRLPRSTISASDFDQLIAAIRAELPRVRRGRIPGMANFTFILRNGLPPDCVMSHFHPLEVPDPLLRGAVYRYYPRGQ